MVKRIICHTSEIVFEILFLNWILRSYGVKDTGEKTGKFYSIMLLQTVDIMRKERSKKLSL